MTLDIQAIRERVNKATPGPWKVEETTYRGYNGSVVQIYVAGLTVEMPDEEDRENGEFIAHAREDVPALLDEIGRLREPVRWFSEQMEAKLRANDHKGGWDKCDPLWLVARLDEEITDLRSSIRRQPQGKSTLEDVIREAADVANLAMMIADIARQALVGESDE